MVDIKPAVDRIVEWVGDNLRSGVPVIGGTQAISDFLVTNMLEPLREFLRVAAVAGRRRRDRRDRVAERRLAARRDGRGLHVRHRRDGHVPGGANGRTQMWDLAMDTLSQVIVAAAHQRRRRGPDRHLPPGARRGSNTLLRPLLDTAQVLPQFVYLVPVLFLFSVGPRRRA